MIFITTALGLVAALTWIGLTGAGATLASGISALSTAGALCRVNDVADASPYILTTRKQTCAVWAS